MSRVHHRMPMPCCRRRSGGRDDGTLAAQGEQRAEHRPAKGGWVVLRLWEHGPVTEAAEHVRVARNAPNQCRDERNASFMIAFLRTLPNTLWWITLTFAIVAALTQVGIAVARSGAVAVEMLLAEFTFTIVLLALPVGIA